MRKICRLCLKSTDNLFQNLNDFQEIVNVILPEININIVSSPLVCCTCTNSLQNAYTFKKNCVESEEKIAQLLNGRNGNDYTVDDLLNGPDVVVKEEVLEIIEDEESDHFVDTQTSRNDSIRRRAGQPAVQKYSCTTCKIDFFLETNFQIHLRGHTGKAYNCETCYEGFDSSAELIKHSADHNNIISHSADHKNTILHSTDHNNIISHSADHNNTISHSTDHKNTISHSPDHNNTISINRADSLDKRNSPHVIQQINSKLLSEVIEAVPVKTASRKKITRRQQCMICGDSFGTLKSFYVHLSDKHTPTLRLVKVSEDEIKRMAHPYKNARRKRKERDVNSQPKKRKPGEELIDMGDEDRNEYFPCEFCDKTFKIYQALQNHLEIHFEKKNTETKFECNCCGLVLTSLELRERHTKEDHMLYEDRKFVCKFCNRRFVDTDTFENHEAKHDDNTDSFCNECPMRFTTTLHYFTHKKYEHSDDACDGCGETFQGGEELTRHLRACTMKFFCKFCDFDAKCKQKLQTHLLTHGLPLAKTTCDVCDFKSTDKLELTEHIKKHSELDDVTCNDCEMSFISSEDLNVHALKHRNQSEPNPYKTCYLCEEICKSDVDLMKHMQNHDDIMDIQCDHCELRFFDELPYCEHVQKVHVICSNCNTKFDDADLMLEHVRLCPKLNSTECRFCKYKSITFVELKRHITSEHPSTIERKCECILCNRRFRTNRDLMWHVEQHDFVKDIRCKYCELRFVSAEHHYQHLVSHKCKFCDVVIESRNRLASHVVKCKKNPEGIEEIAVFGDKGKLTCAF